MSMRKVFDVGSTTPADQAGIRTGDLLLAANGDPIASVDDLQRVMVLGGSPELRLDVLREKRREQIVVFPGRPSGAGRLRPGG
jgi:S1-C subfamily serine protease